MSTRFNRRNLLQWSGAFAVGMVFGAGMAQGEDPANVTRRIVKGAQPHDFEKYRKVLVSPTVNTPENFQGFGGFCGWPKIHRLQNGDLFVTFQAGYWHASWPCPS